MPQKVSDIGKTYKKASCLKKDSDNGKKYKILCNKKLGYNNLWNNTLIDIILYWIT